MYCTHFLKHQHKHTHAHTLSASLTQRLFREECCMLESHISLKKQKKRERVSNTEIEEKGKCPWDCHVHVCIQVNVYIISALFYKLKCCSACGSECHYKTNIWMTNEASSLNHWVSHTGVRRDWHCVCVCVFVPERPPFFFTVLAVSGATRFLGPVRVSVSNRETGRVVNNPAHTPGISTVSLSAHVEGLKHIWPDFLVRKTKSKLAVLSPVNTPWNGSCLLISLSEVSVLPCQPS